MKIAFNSIILNLLLVSVFMLSGHATDVKSTVAVLEFESVGSEEHLGKAVSEIMRTELVETKRFRVVERSQISKVLSEQKFQQSGTIDENNAVEIGKLLGADLVIVGSVVKIGTSYTINSRTIDVKTGEAQLGRNVTGNDLNLLTNLSRSLIASLFGGDRIPHEDHFIPPSKSFKDAVTGMEFILIPGSCYQMGDTFGDGFPNERPVHEVCVNDFYLGKYEVTQGQWQTVMGSNPSKFKSCGDKCPVEQVTWNDVQKFIGNLNSKSGKKYRLPTEAEWEFAGRTGGKREKFAGASDTGPLGQFAWYRENSDKKSHPTGEKQPNELRIFDMTGNVWEWCQDWYGEDYYSRSPRNLPQGPDSGAARVLRGGSWDNTMRYLRTTRRGSFDPSSSHETWGFRLSFPAQ